ncbi:unnamed protein product [Paramecium sonneborni]|uniref:Protein kinase domain-containing protein n=1 Tax=Paramecium sonneborni TaxID=65129 RepID=A0A8S1QHB6_9CILI|nr:unnamed protein product [Paramecium sonneborni]
MPSHEQYKQCEFKKKYIIIHDQIYGEGCYGQIYSCKKLDNIDQNIYCVKIVPINTEDIENLDAESDLQKTISELTKYHLVSKNLVQIIEIILDNTALYIVIEQCDYDLTIEFDLLIEEKKWYQEEEAVEIIQQLITGYQELNSLNIIHQNIKPENILIKYENKGRPNEKKVYKISDFYIAIILSKLNNRNDLIRTGSPNYSAPEVFLRDAISSKSDIYSLGMLFYQICYLSTFPYDCSTMQKRYQSLQKLKNNPLEFPPLTYNNADITNLLKHMIVYDENKRISFEDVIHHPIMKPKAKEDTAELRIEESTNFQSSRLFDKSSNFQKKRFDSILLRSQSLQRLLQLFYLRFKICQYLLSKINDDQNMLFLKLNIYLIARNEILYALAIIFIRPQEIHPYILSNNNQLILFDKLRELQNEIQNNQANFKYFKNLQDFIHVEYHQFQAQFKKFQMLIYLRQTFTNEQELFFEQSRSRRIETTRVINNIIIFQQTQLENISNEEQQLLDQITKLETLYPVSVYQSNKDIASLFPIQISNQENDF